MTASYRELSPHLTGVDLGGTKMAAARIDASSGSVEAFRVIGTPTTTDSLVDSLRDLLSEVGVDTRVGLGVPAPVNREGEIAQPPNLPALAKLDRQTLENALNVRLTIANDANCAALAEARLGVGSGHDDMLFVSVGTGIGGAHVVHQDVQLGATGAAGEIGHIRVTRGVSCGCGRDGCLETVASGGALDRAAKEIGLRDGKDLMQAAEAGDSKSRAAVRTWAAFLADGIASAVFVTDPEVVVLGGGVFGTESLALPAVQAAFRKSCPGPRTSWPLLKAALLGSKAGAIGAALLTGAPSAHGDTDTTDK